jgi:hypothetical protein
VVSRSQRKHWRISASLVDVSARNRIDIGQTASSPSCGPPIPSAAEPWKKYGLSVLSTKARVR